MGNVAEPTIDPGMILERGRERITIVRDGVGTGNKSFELAYYQRPIFGKWPCEAGYKDDDRRTVTKSATHVRYLLLSGFKVIRAADSVA